MPTESECCIEMKQVWFSSLITVIITYCHLLVCIHYLLTAYKSAVSDQVRMMVKHVLMSLIKFIVHNTKDEASVLLQKITVRAE